MMSSSGKSSIESLDSIEKVGPDRILPASTYCTSDPDGAVKIRACEAAAQLPALKVKRDGKWITWSYRKYYTDILAIAKAFIRFGLEPHHTVSIQSFNCPEWHIADIAAIFAGGIACGLYLTNSLQVSKFILNDSRTNILIVENHESVIKYLSIKNELQHLRKIVQLFGDIKVDDPDVISWDELLEFGYEIPDDDDPELEQRLLHQSVNQCCTLIYTSGTTGDPKGVMLSHDNIAWTTYMILVELKAEPNTEVFVSFLPLNHIAAQMIDIWIPLMSQGTVYFADRQALKGTLIDTLKEARPTRFLGVPRVWEKFMQGIFDNFRESGSMTKKVVYLAQVAAIRYHLLGKSGIVYKYSQKYVYPKVKRGLGLDRCRTFAFGAAPLSRDVCTFFMSLDMKLMDVYGMSESTGVILTALDQKQHEFRLGSVGLGLPSIKIRIANQDLKGDGEVTVQGRNIMMGYLNRPDKTLEVMDSENWLKTGDLARRDSDGYIFITGRSKDIIVTAGGENVAPVPIEENIKARLSDIVSNAVVIGDKKKYLVAFVSLKTLPDPDNPDQSGSFLTAQAAAWCRKVGSPAETIEDIVKIKDEHVFAAIQSVIDEVNEEAVSNAAKVQKWTILPKDLTISGGELGPTLKLKRFYFYEKYQRAIDRMYDA